MPKHFAPQSKQRKGPSFNIEDVIRFKRDNTNDNNQQSGGNGASSSNNNSNNVNNNDDNEIYWNNKVVHQKESHTKTSDILKLSRHVSIFEFRPPEESMDYFEELEKYVKACVKRVIAEGEKKFGTIDRIGFQVRSDSLDYDLTVPLSPLNANSINSFLNRFEIVDVSSFYIYFNIIFNF